MPIICKRRYEYFRFCGRHLVFPLPVAFSTIDHSFIEIVITENKGVAVEISFLSILNAEI